MDRTDSDIWLMSVIEINGPTERGMAHGKGKNFPSSGQSHRDLQWRGRQGLITASPHFEQESRTLLSKEEPTSRRTSDVGPSQPQLELLLRARHDASSFTGAVVRAVGLSETDSKPIIQNDYLFKEQFILRSPFSLCGF